MCHHPSKSAIAKGQGQRGNGERKIQRKKRSYTLLLLSEGTKVRRKEALIRLFRSDLPSKCAPTFWLTTSKILQVECRISGGLFRPIRSMSSAGDTFFVFLLFLVEVWPLSFGYMNHQKVGANLDGRSLRKSQIKASLRPTFVPYDSNSKCNCAA